MPQACNFIKKETLAQVFSSEFCEISKNTCSYRTPLVTASETIKNFEIAECGGVKILEIFTQILKMCKNLTDIP